MKLLGWFSQKHFEYIKANLSPNIREVVYINRNYPVACVSFIGAYYRIADGSEVLVTHVGYKDKHALYKWPDTVFLGELEEFVRFPDI